MQDAEKDCDERIADIEDNGKDYVACTDGLDDSGNDCVEHTGLEGAVKNYVDFVVGQAGTVKNYVVFLDALEDIVVDSLGPASGAHGTNDYFLQVNQPTAPALALVSHISDDQG